MAAKSKLSNCGYNTSQALARKGAMIWKIDQFIKDAKKEKVTACVKMWQEIKKDEQKHVQMLKQSIAALCKAGKL